MLWTALLLAASPELHEAELSRLIGQWCSVNATRAQERCAVKQTDALERFLAVRQELGEADKDAGERCLRRGASTPSVDWTVAARCLDHHYSRQLAKWAPPAVAPTVPPPPAFPWTPVLPQAGR